MKIYFNNIMKNQFIILLFICLFYKYMISFLLLDLFSIE
jgi:hypothetical protein